MRQTVIVADTSEAGDSGPKRSRRTGTDEALLSGADVSWEPSRTVALKGLSGEHEIWAVDWEDL